MRSHAFQSKTRAEALRTIWIKYNGYQVTEEAREDRDVDFPWTLRFGMAFVGAHE